MRQREREGVPDDDESDERPLRDSAVLQVGQRVLLVGVRGHENDRVARHQEHQRDAAAAISSRRE